MGDDYAPSATESTDESMKAYIKHLPNLLRVTNEEVLPSEQALQNAQNVLAPQRNALELQLLRDYGPQFAEVGGEISAANAQRQASSDLAVLQGPGRDLAREASAVAREADPEYYAMREAGASALAKLFGSADDPNGGLSGAEREEVTRSLARDNSARGLENPTATSTVSNAMKFGAAGAARKSAKQNALAGMIGTAANFLPASQSKVDTFNLVTGRPVQQFGSDRQSGVQQVGQNAFNMGSQLFNQTGQFQQQANEINANRKTGFDRAMQGVQAIGGAVGGII